MKIQFLGAAHTVTGSRTLLSHGSSKILIDCGLFQGPKVIRDLNWEPFRDASSIQAVLLTHAHLDHSGFLPRLVKDGFRGLIYCSRATLDLCRILLMDAARLQEEDAQFANQTGYSNHKPALPLYTTEDVGRCLEMFCVVDRDKWIELSGELSFRLLRSGHILGSSFVEISENNSNGGKSILFSGDLGNGRSEILKPPLTGMETDFLVLESTYGNRNQTHTPPEKDLAVIIKRVSGRDGVLVIPAFSVGRTQEVLFLLRKLEDAGQIPKLPVFVDSPMANHATDIFFKHPEDHNLILDKGYFESPLCPSYFTATQNTKDSTALAKRKGPMIVISAAGMLTGGRVMHHLKSRLPDERNALLFVGYQALETKGRLLQDGIKDIRIHHETIPVRCEILTLDGLSAHADADDLIVWVKALRNPPKKIFLNHGDNGAPEALAQRIKKELGIEVVIPKMAEEFAL